MLAQLVQRLFEFAYLLIPCGIAVGVVLLFFGHKKTLFYAIVAFLLICCGGLALIERVASWIFTGR